MTEYEIKNLVLDWLERVTEKSVADPTNEYIRGSHQTLLQLAVKIFATEHDIENEREQNELRQLEVIKQR